MARISVIVPVYGVEKYLRDCIDSLLKQTFEDIEFIFVNDASPDNCGLILREYENKYPSKIKVIDSPENRRQGGARNLGLTIATGEYIGYCDSDDLCSPDMFETLFKAITKSGAEAAFILSGIIMQDESLLEAESRALNGTMKLRASWNRDIKDIGDGRELQDNDREVLIASKVGGVYDGLYKRELIERIPKFPEHLSYEDNYWGTMLFSSIRSLALIEEIKHYYRKNPTSTVNTKNARFHYDRIVIEHMILDAADKKGYFKRYHDAFEYCFTFRGVFNTCFLLLNRFDSPPKGDILNLLSELKQRFPSWSKNKYYLKYTPRKKRIKDKLLYYCPSLFIALKTLKVI